MDKWLQGVSPDDRTGDVAAQALRGRLAAVAHFLPLAADHADEGPVYVHELRVWSRRAAAAVKLFAGLLPPHRRDWVKKRLKRLRRAAGEARDCDVLIRRLAHRPGDPAAARWLAKLRARRATAQRPIVELAKHLGHGNRFARHGKKLVAHVAGRDGDGPRFGDWARQHLRPVMEEFFAAAPADAGAPADWHQFRIRGKKLRYAMELLAGAFPPGFRGELYPVVEQVQDRLGAINDLVTAQERLGEEVDGAGELDRLRQEFREWFTPRRQADLRAGFEEYLAAPASVLPLRGEWGA